MNQVAFDPPMNRGRNEVQTLPSRGLRSWAGALPLLIAAIVIGAGCVIAYAFRLPVPADSAPAISTGLLTAGGSLFAGAVIGFLFGIPRSLQGDDEGDETESPAEARRYRANTNLEEISDWLTKILVGAGLTQLVNIPSGLSDLGTYVASGMGDPAFSRVFAPAVVVYFSVCGVFLSYLWTRLNLNRLFNESDLLAEIRQARKEAKADTEQEFLDKISAASAVKATGLTAFWVDDRPSNNRRESEMFRNSLNIEVEHALSTREALEKLDENPRKYAVVLSYMSRPEGRHAGFDLLDELRRRGITIPFVIYSGSNQYDAEARRRGALGGTNSPIRLLELVSDAVKMTKSRD
jgi:CheY-like chemotaxis protein